MSGFKITVKGVFYELRAYKEFRDEWDLSYNHKLLCDSRPFHKCMEKFLECIKDTPEEIEKFIQENYGE